MIEPIFDATKFKYEIVSGDDGLRIYLTRIETGELKVFFQAGIDLPHQPFIDHMNSLTDDLLTSFFVKTGGKPKKEKK